MYECSLLLSQLYTSASSSQSYNIQLYQHVPTRLWILLMHHDCVMLQLDDPHVIEVVLLYLPLSFDHGSWFLMYKAPFDPLIPSALR